jgi:pyridoxal phosphate enzyme (YggS family)
MIETVDSLELAVDIDKRCAAIDKVMPVLIEVNSGREAQKSGVLPEDTKALVKEVACLKNLSLQGLMTIGPYTTDPEDARPYFAETHRLFERIKEHLPNVEMRYLSMGMSDSYRVAIEEGANIIRLGNRIFGPRS